MKTTSSSSAPWLIHFTLAWYALLWWSVQPVFPYLSSQLGASPTQIGFLSSASQLAQLVGAPFMGRLMDKRGPRTALLLSHCFAALSYFLLSVSYNIPTLYLSQLPTFFAAAMHASQTYLTYVSTPERRAAALGSLSLSYGVGMVIGPTIGGALSQWLSYQAVALAASLASLGVMAVIFVLLPAITADSSAQATAAGAASSSSRVLSLLSTLRSLLSLPVLRHLLVFKLLCNFAISLYRNAFTLLLKDGYLLSSQQNGYVLSAVGLLSIAANTLLVPRVVSLYRSSAIITSSLLLLTLSFLAVPFTTSLQSLLCTIVPITVAATVAATIITSALTVSSARSNAGAVLGVDHSVSTLARLLAPPVAGVLLEAGQTQVGLACGLVTGLAWLVSTQTVWTEHSGQTKQPAAAAAAAVAQAVDLASLPVDATVDGNKAL